MDSSARLLVRCKDTSGIIAAVTGFLFAHGANVTDLDQHATESEGGTFLMRLELSTEHLDVAPDVLERLFADEVAARFGMSWRLSFTEPRPKVAILVSKQDHALLELLWRGRRGELGGEVTMVISNHPTAAQAAKDFGVPFHHVPVEADKKPEAEARILALLEGQADLVVLARYMQILSPEFVGRYPERIINIHHSFLPAFIGADPYRQAWERGVKIIGATAHYVTADLDEGPIIEQAVARVTHRHGPQELRALGRDLERQALARAVRWHLEDRILLDGHKTVVFD